MSQKVTNGEWVEWMLGELPECLLQAWLEPGDSSVGYSVSPFHFPASVTFVLVGFIHKQLFPKQRWSPS